ncbi:phage tail protein [Vibrio vulnificus]|nr:phage tail protein [Vibrio vulnificus]
MANSTDKSILTAAGKALLAQLNAEEKALVIDKMIFANVPNRPEYPQPDDVVPTDHVVHQEGVEQRGRLTADSVIYSTTLTSGVGPFEFNWTGAYCSEHGVLVTIDHHALTPKTADEPGVAGNTLVRSVVLEYKDIAEITNITVDASSWQYNATPRMKKMDEDVAQAIIDQNGKDWFIDDGFLVTPSGSAYNIKAGGGYVSGNRVAMEFDRSVQVPNKPSFIYIDAHREGTPTGEQVTLFDFVITAEEKDDYTDANGVKHFVCKIAQVLSDGSVSDLRPEGESADKEWVKQESSHTINKTSRLKVHGSTDLKVGDILAENINAVVVNGELFKLDKPLSGEVTAIGVNTVTVGGVQAVLLGGASEMLVSSRQSTLSRALSDVYDDSINVLDYGLVRDGFEAEPTDNAPALKQLFLLMRNRMLNARKVIFPTGGYYLDDFREVTPPYCEIDMRGSTWLFNGQRNYGTMMMVRNDAGFKERLALMNGTLDFQGAHANAIALGPLAHVSYYENLKFKNINSRVYVEDGSTFPRQSEGGTAFSFEMPGTVTGGNITFENVFSGFRVGQGSERDDMLTVNIKGVHAEKTEVIVQTTASDWGPTQGMLEVDIDEQANQEIHISDITFKDCGYSSHERVQNIAFEYIEHVGAGSESGNYFPWYGFYSENSSLAKKSNWKAIPYDETLPLWDSNKTYTTGEKCRVVNNGRLGALFAFNLGRNVHITKVRGENSYNRANYQATPQNPDGSTGYIGAIARGTGFNCTLSDVRVDVACDYLFESAPCPSCSYTASPAHGSHIVELIDVVNKGQTRHALVESQTPIAGTWSSKNGDITIDAQTQHAVNVMMTKNVSCKHGGAKLVGDNLKGVESNHKFTVDLGFVTAPYGTSKFTSVIKGKAFKFRSLLPNDAAYNAYSGGYNAGNKELASEFVLSHHNSDVASGGIRGVATSDLMVDFWINPAAPKGVRLYDYFNSLEPLDDNSISLGRGPKKYSAVYSHTGAIQTSDARMKTEPQPIDERVFAAWSEVEFCQFKYLEAVNSKGEDGARWHIGIIAQHIKYAFEKHGLNAFDYGLLCYDEWEEQLEITDEEGNTIVSGSPAGNMYSIRVDECMFLESAFIRWKLSKVLV